MSRIDGERTLPAKAADVPQGRIPGLFALGRARDRARSARGSPLREAPKSGACCCRAVESAREMSLSLRQVCLWRIKHNFACDAVRLGVTPSFPGF
jgi:hypothetical protein